MGYSRKVRLTRMHDPSILCGFPVREECSRDRDRFGVYRYMRSIDDNELPSCCLSTLIGAEPFSIVGLERVCWRVCLVEVIVTSITLMCVAECMFVPPLVVAMAGERTREGFLMAGNTTSNVLHDCLTFCCRDTRSAESTTVHRECGGMVH